MIATILSAESLVVLVVGAAAGFVVGILVGRRNSQKVEAAVAEANKAIADVTAEVKALAAKIKV